MNDQLLLEILKTLQRGQSNSRETVKKEIFDMQGFADLNEKDLKVEWDILIENKCIIDYRGEETNNLIAFKNNPNKDCISIYETRISEQNRKDNENKEIGKLSLDNLLYQTTIRDLEKRVSELSVILSTAK